MRLAICKSLGIIVTRFAWIAHRFTSSNRVTKHSSETHWSACIASEVNRMSDLYSWASSLTSRWKGSFRNSRLVDFWYFRISRRATVPGRYLRFFLTPPSLGPFFLAHNVANCFLGAFPPVLLLADCLVRAIFFGFRLPSSCSQNTFFCPLFDCLLGDTKHLLPTINRRTKSTTFRNDVFQQVLWIEDE